MGKNGILKQIYTYVIKIKIIDTPCTQLSCMSDVTCTEMGLVTIYVINWITNLEDDNIIKEFSDVFEGLGCLETQEPFCSDVT